MAITIQQSPTTPNMANNTLVYGLQSNKVTEPQFQFVCDLTYSGSSAVLQRIKQQPNPEARAVFDVGSIISNYVDSDNVWKTQGFTTSSNAAKRFSVKFGEQYGTSVSSSITLYDGNGNVGQPAVTASSYSYYVNGLTNPNDKINWNFPSSSYYTLEDASVYNTFSYQHTLTNASLTQSVQDGEYHTISFFNGNFDNNAITAQDIFYVQIRYYNAAGGVLGTDSLTNVEANGGGPRINPNDLWDVAYVDQTAGTQLIHIGIGPQNLTDIGFTLPAAWAYYTVEIFGQGDDGLENSDGVWANLRFNKATGECSYNGVRFAWKNEFGVWDYYTFTLQNDKTANIDRQTYEQTFVPFGNVTPVVYDKTRRGITNYLNAITENQTANSNWLTDAESHWLKELFYSANVFIQEGLEFIPVVITSAAITEKTNPRTQKMFQSTIEFQVANQPNPRI